MKGWPVFLMALVPFGAFAAPERFACNATALDPTERARYGELSSALKEAAQEKSEIAKGYAFRFPAASLLTVAEWVSLERRCCPFFTFALEQSRDSGPVWLKVTGPKGVKEFIREEFGF